MKPFLLLASAACLSGMAASPKAEAQNMPFRSSLHGAALREALGDSVLSLAQTADTAAAGSPWSQWHVRHVRLSALEWGKKVLWHDAAGHRPSQGVYYRDGTLTSLAWAKEADVTVGGDQQNIYGMYWTVYLRDGDSRIARDYRPLLQQWLPEGTKIVQTHGECPRNSEEIEYESAHDLVGQKAHLGGSGRLWQGRLQPGAQPHL